MMHTNSIFFITFLIFQLDILIRKVNRVVIVCQNPGNPESDILNELCKTIKKKIKIFYQQ